MAADLKLLARRFVEEVLNHGNIDLIDELLHEDFVEHEEMPPGVPPGREASKAMIPMLRNAFPDLHATVEDMIREGTKVVIRTRMRGTHRGEFMGMPATGNLIDVQAIDIMEFRGERCSAHWGITDSTAMMMQLGMTE
jgi:steroid delta-isomerase-like uncharacterized protein